jgi:UDP-3-O-[3-hydroxymyristoyl] glucosamine N-acyltransferase
VPAGRVLLGYPAMKMDQNIEVYKALRRLPRLMERVAALEKRVPKDAKPD